MYEGCSKSIDNSDPGEACVANGGNSAYHHAAY